MSVQNFIPAKETAERSLKAHQAITLSLLFLAGIVNFLDRSSLSVANTTIRGEMHLSATQMGWLLSAFSLAYGFAQLPLIGLLDRAGTRSVLGVGLVLWSTAQMLTGFVRGFPMFLVFRVFLGIGEAPFYPSGVRSVREWFSRENAWTRHRDHEHVADDRACLRTASAYVADGAGWLACNVHRSGRLGACGCSGMDHAAPCAARDESADCRSGTDRRRGRVEGAPAATNRLGHDARLRRHQLHQLALHGVAARLPAGRAASLAGEERMGGRGAVSRGRGRHDLERRACGQACEQGRAADGPCIA